MCIDLEGHHSGGSSIVNVKYFCYYRNYVCITTGTSSALRKNRSMRVPAVQSRTPDSVWIRQSGRIGKGGVT